MGIANQALIKILHIKMQIFVIGECKEMISEYLKSCNLVWLIIVFIEMFTD